jgi:ferric-dicitrate binding protein FerR (iron transport regulator)
MPEKTNQPNESRLHELFDAYLTGALKAEDREDLARALGSPEGEELLKSVMERDIDEAPPVEVEGVKAGIDRWLDEKVARKGRVVSLKRWGYGVAAAVLIGLIGYVVYRRAGSGKEGNVVVAGYRNDLSPGGNVAVLRLSDGKTVELNAKEAGDVRGQNDAVISRDSGWVSYQAGSAVRFNDVFTPTGGQVKLALADGTRVWLDASSSIHFPTAFPSGPREVTVTGQAYFEVAPNSRQAFLVHVKDQTIQVLGTHFNVNAYAGDGSVVKTTLEQGSVLVRSGTRSLLLKPGEQADGMNLKKDADLEEVLAWKNGEFRFKGAPIEVIMEQVSRWYGAEVVYKDKINEEFVARVPRDVPASKLLHYLEETGQVHFSIEDKTITVMK